jgi:nitrate reductase gamma subunit
VRATISGVDYLALILLLSVMLTGIAPTIGVDLLGRGYDYRTRHPLGPWFVRRLPRPPAFASAPLICRTYATFGWAIWAVWPFSRLVHSWSYPLWYL